ncbi:phenylacetic acid degradation-like protein [Streptomyces albus]|uniref:Phenylacetic acid degradation-like protein n=1 Tax=Streptomyces albus (strain ATCC 21838 / DSM 41398 / FERM P-419 / JCM 4703 / NBRC 107858) TaxID=1081613 RepID=A0A0B5EQ36_STRA4|nr:phenylacetic acid degradation-like protein [Streptomyces albus]AOU75205.1 phenylacetic acid degradation-like protein [Streptomyces albus]AYN31009.1 PaaI family thioesterase [Streptomyces albus]
MGRSRTYEWEDPSITAAVVGRVSGLEFLREIQAGRLPGPPVSATLDFTLAEVDEGRVTFTIMPGEEHYNPLGSVHGGVYATLLDSAAGCAVHSTLPPGMGYTSLDLTVKFLKRITADTGLVRAVGTVVSRGRQTALAEARLLDTDDRLLAHATSSCLLFPLPAA